jgi:predicted branched-subunit amino acid permease
MAAVTAVSVDRAERLDPAAARRAGATGGLAMLPMLAGVVPFGLLVGASIAPLDDAVPSLLASIVIFGGSAQLAANQLLADGAGLAVTVLTVLVINARLVVYSGALAPLWRDHPRRFRVVAALFVVEPTYALGRARALDGGSAAERRWHYAGAAGLLVVGWIGAIGAGLTVGGRVGPEVGLELGVPLSLLAMIVPELRARPTCAVALASAVAAVLLRGLPMGSGLLVAVGSGVVAGRMVRRWSP